MRIKLKLFTYILLICLCIGIFAGCCANSDEGSGNSEWYIKIYIPDGCIEAPGTVIYTSHSGFMLVEMMASNTKSVVRIY